MQIILHCLIFLFFPDPKKGDKGSSEGSSGTQQSTASSSSGGVPPPQRQGPSIRQQLQQITVSDRPAQQPQGQSRPQQQGGQQQAQSRPQQQQQQPGPSNPQKQKQQQQPRSGAQQQNRPQQGQAQQQQQSRPDNRPQQQQQQNRPQQGQSQQQSRPQQQQQQQRRPQHEQGGGQRQQPRGDRKPQGGMQRAESTQSIQSEKSTGSGGGFKQQQNRPAPITFDDLKKKGIPELSVKYKGPGKKGRKLPDIETNYLKLIMNKLVDNAYHYDVKFEPDKPKKLLTMVFLEFARINFPRSSIAFDGTNNAYASQPLQIGDLQREIRINHPQTGRQRTYIVTIQAANDSQIPIRRLLTT